MKEIQQFDIWQFWISCYNKEVEFFQADQEKYMRSLFTQPYEFLPLFFPFYNQE